jgi:hypothetical protein
MGLRATTPIADLRGSQVHDDLGAILLESGG